MKITAKDYRQHRVHTVPIDNNRAYRDWMHENYRERHVLFQDNRAIFRELFGKPHFHFRSEFDFHVWVLEHEGETYLVLTAKGKGTCIEMVRPQWRGIDSKSEQILSFAKFLLEKINGTTERIPG